MENSNIAQNVHLSENVPVKKCPPEMLFSGSSCKARSPYLSMTKK